MGLRTPAKYFLGFNLISPANNDSIVEMPLAAVNVVKGDVLIDNGNGYLTNAAVTVFTATFRGIANANVDNSAGAVGDKNILVISPTSDMYFWVPVENNAAIAQTNVGTIVDLESEDGIDISDTTLTAATWGFEITDFDASAAAVAANTYGFAYGRFIKQ